MVNHQMITYMSVKVNPSIVGIVGFEQMEALQVSTIYYTFGHTIHMHIYNTTQVLGTVYSISHLFSHRADLRKNCIRQELTSYLLSVGSCYPIGNVVMRNILGSVNPGAAGGH